MNSSSTSSPPAQRNTAARADSPGAADPTSDGHGPCASLEVIESIQKRVLWLSTQIVHHANVVRPNPDGVKVGGHQASSASVVGLMTALYFHALRPGDLVSVKPHAAPVFHAIQFLLGNLPGDKLRQLRGYQGLQAYPSRTKDPDPVDFSTGSVGLGAVMPNFAALARQYVHDHFGLDTPNRFIALVGDAEFDEGSIWEALGEDHLRGLGRILWVVDLNRQSLDRVTPSGKAQQIEEMFRLHGWHVIELKYGRRLQEYYARPGGERLRHRIDLMSNEEYQSLLRLRDGAAVRDRLARINGEPDAELLDVLSACPPAEVKALLANLGGHDLSLILDAYAEADRTHDRPVVIIAYTIKGWGLPIAGDPENHSKLLSQAQMDELQRQLDVPPGEEFGAFPAASAEDCAVELVRRRLGVRRAVAARPALAPSVIPGSLATTYEGRLSTQQVLGRLLTALGGFPEVAARIVTTSPDVASSTNLGGWINRVGVYHPRPRTNYFKENQIAQLVNWEQGPRGQQIELGISENNFFLLLGALGLAGDLFGETLLPVGTIYDIFIARGLDALTYALYNQSKFIFAGTPSGVSLSREGGAHQSLITPSIGMELPHLVYCEPCFAKELEWMVLAGLRNLLDRQRGRSVYLRLSTVPVDQSLFPAPGTPDDEAALVREVVCGGYRLLDHRGSPGYDPRENVANIFACGVMVPVALEASRRLAARGILANVVSMTSPDLLYRGWRQAVQMRRTHAHLRPTCHLERLIPEPERGCPIVTVIDGHSHTLSFVGGVFGTRTVALGVDTFGQTGSRQELYDHYGVSVSAVVNAVESLWGPAAAHLGPQQRGCPPQG
jgi:pyruvate dehydrogenase E1 component